MSANCFSIIRGKRIRVTRLLPGGVLPDPEEADAVAVSSGFVTVSLSPEVEDGEEISVTNANGDLCVNDQSPHRFKRWTLEIELCQVDPGLLGLMTSITMETDSGDPVGFRTPDGAITNEFALELWTGIPDADVEEGVEYGYLLLPHVGGGSIGGITVENDASTFTVENAYTRGGGSWGVGPYDVIGEPGSAAPLGVAMGAREHLLLRSTQIAPPDADCGTAAMPAA